jgi:hypothetical protein
MENENVTVIKLQFKLQMSAKLLLIIKGGKCLPKRSNTNVRRVTEGTGIIVAGCCAGITDILSSVSV